MPLKLIFRQQTNDDQSVLSNARIAGRRNSRRLRQHAQVGK